MLNTKHLLKVSAWWVSIVYTICFLGVAIYPPIRGLYMRFALHTEVSMGLNYISFNYFVYGLIIWNIVALLGVWLFALLFNKIKQ